jgi:voltage-gated potassium channel
MLIPFFVLAKIRGFLRKNLVRLPIFVLIVVGYGTVSEYFLERGAVGSGVKSPFDALWFVMQTITTVGYGDTPVVTFWGRVNAIALMIVGIGVLGFFSASFATLLIDYSTARRLGERRIKMKNHVLICNWNSIADELVAEVVKEKSLPLVLLAPLERSPSEGVEFVKGTCLHQDDLLKASVRDASSVIILAETIIDGELAGAIDAKTILGVMNTRKLSKDAHIVAELLRQDSVDNAREVGADEVVVRGQVSARLLSRGALYPGTIEIVETLLTAKSGEEIYEDSLPEWAIGKPWAEVSKSYLEKNVTPIALRNDSGILVNPPRSTLAIKGMTIVYISTSRLKIP